MDNTQLYIMKRTEIRKKEEGEEGMFVCKLDRINDDTQTCSLLYYTKTPSKIQTRHLENVTI